MLVHSAAAGRLQAAVTGPGPYLYATQLITCLFYLHITRFIGLSLEIRHYSLRTESTNVTFHRFNFLAQSRSRIGQRQKGKASSSTGGLRVLLRERYPTSQLFRSLYFIALPQVWHTSTLLMYLSTKEVIPRLRWCWNLNSSLAKVYLYILSYIILRSSKMKVDDRRQR